MVERETLTSIAPGRTDGGVEKWFAIPRQTRVHRLGRWYQRLGVGYKHAIYTFCRAKWSLSSYEHFFINLSDNFADSKAN